jgi:hypothetical protein
MINEVNSLNGFNGINLLSGLLGGMPNTGTMQDAAAQTGAPSDSSMFSRETAQGDQGAAQGAAQSASGDTGLSYLKSMWESLLTQDCAAASQEGQSEQAEGQQAAQESPMQKLQEDYQNSQGQGVQLSEQLQKMIQSILGGQGGSGTQAAAGTGSEPGSAMAGIGGSGATAGINNGGNSIWNNIANFGQNIYNQGQNLYNQGKGAVSNLFSSFAQGKEGNCASIGVIKAAMDKYGKNVFNQVSQTGDGGYAIKMKDGKSVNLTAQEMQVAKQKANLKGNGGQDQEYATLCYAAMAKRAQMDGHEGARDFSKACDSLNNGEDPLYAAKTLGMSGHVQMINAQTAGNTDGAVAWTGKHCVYVDGGKTDKYGQAVAFDGTDTWGNRLSNAFKFV